MHNTNEINKRNEQGFTLLEVMIAGAIGVIVAFSVAKTAINATQAQRSSELDLAQVAMLSRLENAIDDPSLCPTMWATWNSGTSTFDAAKFDPAGTTVIDRLTDGAPTNVALTTGAAGGPTSGLTVETMTFTEPFQVSDNTYDWTFTIKSNKVLGDTPTPIGTNLRRFRLEVTTDGSPTFKAVSCGPPVSPEANQQVPMLRFTSNSVPGDSADAVMDAACTAEFSSMYSAATAQDLVAYRMILWQNLPDDGTGDAQFVATQFEFTVSDMQFPHLFTNSINPTAGSSRPPGTIVDVKQGVAADGPHVACIRNTAPLRFVRGFYPANQAGKDTLCKTNVGWAYAAASVNDLIRYGFRSSDGAVGGSMPSGSPGAVFEDGGAGLACRMGWNTAAPAGPGIDCTVGGSYPVACVLR